MFGKSLVVDTSAVMEGVLLASLALRSESLGERGRREYCRGERGWGGNREYLRSLKYGCLRASLADSRSSGSYAHSRAMRSTQS